MANLSETERQDIVRDVALELVDHMGVTKPPVWIENLLKNPRLVYVDRLSLEETFVEVLDALYVWSDGELLVPQDMPLVERRFALASELFNIMTTGIINRLEGLAKLLVPELGEYASYFARVLLAPDSLVHAYQIQGYALDDFANAFLIPNRIAVERWQDPILITQNPVEPFNSAGFSPS